MNASCQNNLTFSSSCTPFSIYLFWFLIRIRYCCWWDMTYDWGLLQPGQRLLRPELKFSRIFYYWAIMSNIILRCSWAVALSPNVGTSNDLLLFVLQIAEIFRRMQWFVIRVEWESNKTASTANPLQLKTRFTVSSPRSSQACFFLLLALLLFMQATNSF